MRRPARSLVALIALLLAATADAALLTRGPYLQMPGPHGMTVRWRTDVPTTSEVAYGAAPGGLSSTVGDPTLTTEHSIVVAGLTADTTYYYSVGEIGAAIAGNDAAHHFRTAPLTGTARPLRLWSIGDAGFTGVNLDAVRDAYTTFNGGGATDLFLLLGDNAYLTGTDGQYQTAVFDEHQALLRSTPVWSVVGNHEAVSSNSITGVGPYFDMFTFPTAAELGGVASGTESYFSFDYGAVHFIVLDSEQAPAAAGTPMLLWLEADLQGAVLQNPDWIVALWHRPPYSKGLLHDSDTETNEIRMRQFALPLLDQYGVDVVFCGHSHSYERSYLLDAHYGSSATFGGANQVDPGDGNPNGDGAYRKADTGISGHSGVVYVVNGSGSDVRMTTLNHPAMVAGLLELGSVVIDIDGDSLTAQFVNSTAAVHDAFRIVKGRTCPSAPAAGCGTAPKGKLRITDGADPTKDKWIWKWRGGTLAAGDLGDPSAQTDLAVCVYDATGALLGGSLLHATPGWAPTAHGLRYSDSLGAQHGLRTLKLNVDAGTILAKAKGSAAGVPSLPAAFPLRAQLVNLDSGTCWESAFAIAKTNSSKRVVATLP
ncbi:MAG: metallophosphoesterase family protein [bacterium]